MLRVTGSQVTEQGLGATAPVWWLLASDQRGSFLEWGAGPRRGAVCDHCRRPSQGRRELSQRVEKEGARGWGPRGRVAPSPGSHRVCGNQPEMSSYTGAGSTRPASALRRLQEPPRVGDAGSGAATFHRRRFEGTDPRVPPTPRTPVPITSLNSHRIAPLHLSTCPSPVAQKPNMGKYEVHPGAPRGPPSRGGSSATRARLGRARGAGLPGPRPRHCPRC